MYAQEQKRQDSYSPSMTAKADDYWAGSQKTKSSNPYGGVPIQISGNLANHMKESFGIQAKDLKLRESTEVAEMGARATAQGNVVRFAPGEFRPDTKEGLEVLGHELSHVREQALGGVHSNVSGSNFHYDEKHEAASDRAGEAFASGSLSAASTVSLSASNAAAAPVQGLFGGLRRRFKAWRERRKGKALQENPFKYTADDWDEEAEAAKPWSGPYRQIVNLKPVEERPDM